MNFHLCIDSRTWLTSVSVSAVSFYPADIQWWDECSRCVFFQSKWFRLSPEKLGNLSWISQSAKCKKVNKKQGKRHFHNFMFWNIILIWGMSRQLLVVYSTHTHTELTFKCSLRFLVWPSLSSMVNNNNLFTLSPSLQMRYLRGMPPVYILQISLSLELTPT